MALVAAGLAMAPALGAPGRLAPAARQAPASSYAIDSFTPAAADPRLAAVFARSGLDTSSFSFTPTDSRRSGAHAVTVAVRARSSRTALAAEHASSLGDGTTGSINLAPIAYNLGVSVGWRRFALSGDVSKVDLAGMPGSREAVDVGVSYVGSRFTGRVKAGADRALPNSAPKLIEEAPAYSLDVGGSYRLTRNLDVTAGVRYKAERDRLTQLSDENHDSRSVYIGTAFRF